MYYNNILPKLWFYANFLRKTEQKHDLKGSIIMALCKTYLQAELGEKIPKKVLRNAWRYELGKDENVLAVMGKTVLEGAAKCLIATDDRLLYFDSSFIPIRYMLMYDDLAEVKTITTGRAKRIVIVTGGGNKRTIAVNADPASADRMADFINGYKATGAALIKARLASGADYQWRVDATRANKSFTSARLAHECDLKLKEIDRQYAENVENLNRETEEKLKQIDEKKKEVTEKYDREIREDHEKYQSEIQQLHNNYSKEQSERELKFMKQHEENQQKINQMTSHRHYYTHKLNYRSGIETQPGPCPVSLTMDSSVKMMIISVSRGNRIQIPFEDIRGSYITTDEQLPAPEKIKPDEDKTVYTYVLHIRCEHEGEKSEIVFTRPQKQFEVVDIIGQLNYAMQHIGEIIEWSDAENAKDNQSMEKLAEQREVLLQKRSEQMNDLHEKINALKGINAPETSGADDTSAAAPANKFDEVKNYKDLLDQGIITQEEFDAKKKELLGL